MGNAMQTAMLQTIVDSVAENEALRARIAELEAQLAATKQWAQLVVAKQWQPVGDDYPDEGEIRNDYDNWWQMHEGLLVAGYADGQEFSVDLTEGYAVCRLVVAGGEVGE